MNETELIKKVKSYYHTYWKMIINDPSAHPDDTKNARQYLQRAKDLNTVDDVTQYIYSLTNYNKIDTLTTLIRVLTT